jgi:hypothetical protein
VSRGPERVAETGPTIPITRGRAPPLRPAAYAALGPNGSRAIRQSNADVLPSTLRFPLRAPSSEAFQPRICVRSRDQAPTFPRGAEEAAMNMLGRVFHALRVRLGFGDTSELQLTPAHGWLLPTVADARAQRNASDARRLALASRAGRV